MPVESATMTSTSRFGGLMFWLMVLLGGALLAPGLILPAWLEYRASVDLRTLRQHQVDARQAEITKLRIQREHLETDDAYVLRVAREDLNIETPGVQRVRVEPEPGTEDDVGAVGPPGAPNEKDDPVPELSALVEELMVRYPLAVRVFLRPETRPPMMFIGAGLVVTAVVLLGAPAGRQRMSAPAARGQD
jgi:hypothetical protein